MVLGLQIFKLVLLAVPLMSIDLLQLSGDVVYAACHKTLQLPIPVY